MKTAVIYQSRYGSTETYAKWIAEELGADLLPAKKVRPADFQRYTTIIYGGGIYAGSVSGLKLLAQNEESLRGKALYLFVVGASDPQDPENAKAVRAILEKSMPPALWGRLHITQLRGGLHYSKMSFLHRAMMGMMIKMLKKKPEAELSPQDKGMIQSKEQDVDFTDRPGILPLVAAVHGN